ncbi:hypothetical protein PCANC_17293 [Puccinia coronata f. sp. avenae]|uniref:Uncharacterized protein n=1 Tax=Puccinia coronata f. sp. avenae TaxID=200324 RepID=A0A2N5UIC3_9BASI|nr:hypothetical protein PCANC_17293 [Puccinia coronata f. sp. avenae]
MRRLLVKYFCMTHILIERGSLKLATATPGNGLNIDLNVAALMEEEPPIPSATGLTFDLNEVLAEEQRAIRPCNSATSRAAPIFVASTRENYDLPGDNSESFAASSSGVSMPSLGTTNDIKRKDLERLEFLQQRMTKIIRAEEPDQNSLKKQVRGAGQDGKWILDMSRVNTLHLEGFGEVPRIRKSKGAILTSQHSLNNFIGPQSTQSRNPVEVLNFKYWSFVKVRKGAEIINDYLEPPGENRNENDLFRYLKTQNHPEQDNSAGVFWIERKYEEDFFISYNHGDPDSKFPYPRGFTISKRASAIREIVLEIYDNKIVASQANDFEFLEKIKTQFNIKELRKRIKLALTNMSANLEAS